MERTRCLLDNHRQNHEILSHSLRLPSELPRASTERFCFHICFTGEEMKVQRVHEAPAQGHTAEQERKEPRTPTLVIPRQPGTLPPPFAALWLNPSWPLAPCKRRGSKINLQRALCHTGSGQNLSHGSHARPRADPSVVQGLPGSQPQGSDLTLTLLRRSPPPWCSGVLVSDALLVFSLLLLGSLSLMMSYWRQKRAMTPAGTRGRSQSPEPWSPPLCFIPARPG